MVREWAYWFRDIKRKRYAEKYRAKHGDDFMAHGLAVTVPKIVSPNIRYILAKGRPYEADEAHFIQQSLPSGMNVIELGGSLGVISRVIRRTIGQDAQHIVVEANPDLAPICRANALCDVKPGLTTVLEGAIAYSGDATIRFSRGETHHSGHIAGPDEQDTFETPTLKLSDVLEKLPKDAVWSLVSDIEGGEMDLFLNEPPKTFEKLAYAVIEIHPDAFGAMGYCEDRFMAQLKASKLTLVDRRADVLLLKGPAA